MAERLIFNPETGELIHTSRHGSLSDVTNNEVEPPAPVRADIQEESDKHRMSDKIRAVRMAKRLKRALESPDADVRRSALQILISSDASYRELISPLIMGLKDSVEEIRELSLKALRRCNPSATQLKLFQPLLRDRKAEIRSLAIEAIGAFSTKASIISGDVLELVQKNHSIEEISVCIKATGISSASISQISALIRSTDLDIRLKTVRIFALADQKSLPALHLIVPRLDDPNSEVRKAASDAFSQLGFHYSAINEIKRLLKHTNAERRLSMIQLLSECGPSARELSVDLVDLITDKSLEISDVTEHCIDCIGLTKDALKPLIRLSKHPRWQYRKKCLELISKHPEVMEFSTPVIIPLMADKEYEVRVVARRLFPTLGINQDSEAYLKPLLTSTNPEQKRKTILLLKQAGEGALILSHLIIARIEEISFDIAKEAALTLIETGLNTEAWRIAERILRNAKQDRKLLLLNVFTHLGAKARNGLPMICCRLGDSDQVIRDAATDAFVSVGFDSSCLPIVKQLIQHQNREYRLSIIEALGKCGFDASAATEFLNSRLEDTDAEVGRAAKAALRAIQDN
jgi:HEAT repeat protein